MKTRNSLAQLTLEFVLISILVSQISYSSSSSSSQPQKLQNDSSTTSKQNANSTAAAVVATTSEGRSSESVAKKPTVAGGRGGRMLDLDQLAGDIGKSEKIARERMHSGDRQSRILSDDLFLSSQPNKQAKSAGSKREKSGKKMSISGFIPIVSLDSAKEGKQYDLEQDEPEADSPESVSSLLSSYGGQTSLGHASFTAQQPQTQQQQQQQLQNQQFLQDQQSELDRASRRVNGQQQQQLASQIQRPVTALNGQESDCICVPFFQCRNGFLSESQMSKGQLQQLAAANNDQQQQFVNSYQHQTPRALNQQQQDLYNAQTGVNQAGLPAAGGLTNDELIYEQLKKTIESENLQEQAAAFQQPLIDERSASGKATLNQTAAAFAQSELLERSLLNPLVALRRSSFQQPQQKSCGIMRTCCRLPQSQQLQSQFSQSAFGNFAANTQRLPARLLGTQVSRPFQPARPQTQMKIQPQPQPQLQLLRPQQQQQQQQPQTSTLIDQYQQQPTGIQSQFSQPAGAQTFGAALSGIQQHQPGDFMAGRCGLKQTIGISGRVQNQQPTPGSESTAEFGEFPSHVAILKRLPSANGDSLFLCSAVLISNQWLATAAHCVRKLRAEELKVRLGEWDVSRDDEFYPFVESNIRDIIIHPDFQPSSLINDLALLRMDVTIDPAQMPHITPACLATPGETFSGQRCWLTGWGKDAFGQSGSFQSVLKKVDLPVFGRQDCEMALRYQTKLGKFFRLHQSAICAGGERGKDACEGDGGAGLYCTDPNSGLTKVAGLVSWGVGCGQVGVPGVYTNLASFYGWIEQVAASSGEESLYMDRNSGLPEGAFKSIISERTIGGASTNSTGTQQQQQVTTNTTTNSTQLLAPKRDDKKAITRR